VDPPAASGVLQPALPGRAPGPAPEGAKRQNPRCSAGSGRVYLPGDRGPNPGRYPGRNGPPTGAGELVNRYDPNRWIKSSCMQVPETCPLTLNGTGVCFLSLHV